MQLFTFLAADIDVPSSGLLGGLIGAAGGVGFAIWYGYYVTTKTIPSIVNDFREERKLDRADRDSERKEFSAALNSLGESVRSIPCRFHEAAPLK